MNALLHWKLSTGYPSFTLTVSYSKYQPFLQMSELPVRCCSTVGSNTAWFK